MTADSDYEEPTARAELESPFLDGELAYSLSAAEAAPTNAWYEGESPFLNSHGVGESLLSDAQTAGSFSGYEPELVHGLEFYDREAEDEGSYDDEADWVSEENDSLEAEGEFVSSALFDPIKQLLPIRLWQTAWAILTGDRDEGKLTNLIFFAKHPERSGAHLSKLEPDFLVLSREWTDIREKVVRPYLVNSAVPVAPGPYDSCTIEDRTSHGWKDRRKATRAANKVDALVLHQMAFSRGSDPSRYDKVGSHFIITPDGHIAQLHPATAYLWASNGFNRRSVAVEFAGNLPSIRGKWYKPEKYGRNHATPQQIVAGRCLVNYLIRTLGISHVFAHRQASATRDNDPGPHIWQGVAQWAIDTLGLSDGGAAYAIGSGRSIPAEWRTWGSAAPVKEMFVDTEAEDIIHQDGWSETELETTATIGWDSEWAMDDGESDLGDREDSTYAMASSSSWADQEAADWETEAWDSRRESDGEWQGEWARATPKIAELAWDGEVEEEGDEEIDEEWDLVIEVDDTPDAFEMIDDEESEWEAELELWDHEFVPKAVESPGGGRVRNKRDPSESDIEYVQGLTRRIPLHRLAARAWQAMVDAARADGIASPLLLPVSGYRSFAEQTVLWEKGLKKHGTPEKTRKWVAKPGHSAHQSGRAIDLHLGGRNRSGNVAVLRRTDAYAWLVQNARRFGFYPYEREPWHWEYNPPVQAGSTIGTAAVPPATASGPSLDVARAVRQNRRYGKDLGWQRRQDEIARLLGFTDMSPSEERFAGAVADWQQRQGMGVDGIIGPNTWRKMLAALTNAPSTRQFDLARAVRQNRRYGPELGWQNRQVEIEQLLGFTDMSPSEERFAEAVADWQRRQGMGVDGIVGPNTWRKMQAALGIGTPTPNVAHPRNPQTQNVDPNVLKRIAKFDSIIQRVAAQTGIDPNWIKGVIAAETNGDPSSGAGTSGYKGLMQSTKGDDQLEPATSIRSGTEKLLAFRKNISKYAREHDFDPERLDEETLIRLTMVAYNAGPATLKRAMRYAISDGDLNRWEEPQHFQRALIYYGAFSLRTALKTCLEGEHGDRIVTELAKLLGKTVKQFQNKYHAGGRWNIRELWKDVRPAALQEIARWKRQDRLTLQQARSSAPRWLLCSVEFKHNNLRRWYLDKVIQYRRHYQAA